MKKVLGFLVVILFTLTLASLFQPANVFSTAPQKTVTIVNASGTNIVTGTASASTAVVNETVQVVNSLGQIMNTLGGGGGGSGTVNTVTTLGLEVYYSASNAVSGLTGVIHALPYQSHLAQAVEACPQVTYANATNYPLYSMISDGTNTEMVESCSGSCTSAASSTPSWSASIGGRVTDNAGANQIVWENIASGTFAPASACTVKVDAGYTYTLTVPMLVGSNTVPVTIEDDGGYIQSTVTGGAGNAPVIIFDKGTVQGNHAFGLAANQGAAIGESSGNSIDAVVESGTAYLSRLQTNPFQYQQTNWHLSGMGINPNGSVSGILEAAVWESGIDGQGESYDDYVGGGPASSIGWLVDNNPTGSAFTGMFWNNLNFNNVWIGVGNDAIGLKVTSGASGSGGALVWKGGAITDGSSHTTSHIDLEGQGGGAFYTADFISPYIETATGESSSTTNGIVDNGVGDLGLTNVNFDGGPTIANCIKVSGSNTGKITTDGYVVTSICNNVIDNTINSYTNTASGAYFNYSYPALEVANGGMGCASPGTFSQLPAVQSIGMTCTITDATTCTSGAPVSGGGSTTCQVTWLGSSWVSGGVSSSGGTGFLGSVLFSGLPATPATGSEYLLTDTPMTPTDLCITGAKITTGTGSAGSFPYCPVVNAGSSASPQWFVVGPRASESVYPLAFHYQGTVANSQASTFVCPTTIRYATNLATLSPALATQTGCGTNGSASDLFTLTNLSNSNVIERMALSTTCASGGASSYTTPSCSFGTVASGQATRVTTATQITVTVPSIAAPSDGSGVGLVVAFYGSCGSAQTWSIDGASTITGFASAGSVTTPPCSNVFYKTMTTGDEAGGTVIGDITGTGVALTAQYVQVPGVVPTGSIVDTSHVQHNAAGTTNACADSGATPGASGDYDLFLCGVSAAAPTISSLLPSTGNNSISLLTQSQGTGSGSRLDYLGTAATGTQSATLGSSNPSTGATLLLLPYNKFCTACIAGQTLKMAAPAAVATPTAEADVDQQFGGITP